jgi:hypothetical protein
MDFGRRAETPAKVPIFRQIFCYTELLRQTPRSFLARKRRPEPKNGPKAPNPAPGRVVDLPPELAFEYRHTGHTWDPLTVSETGSESTLYR